MIYQIEGLYFLPFNTLSDKQEVVKITLSHYKTKIANSQYTSKVILWLWLEN